MLVGASWKGGCVKMETAPEESRGQSYWTGSRGIQAGCTVDRRLCAVYCAAYTGQTGRDKRGEAVQVHGGGGWFNWKVIASKA